MILAAAVLVIIASTAARDVHLLFLPADPKWDQYGADERFADLLARCGFVQPRSTQTR